MRRNFKVELPPNWKKDPRMVARAGLGVLLLLNLVAAFFVFRPIGGSAESLDAEIASMQSDIQRRQLNLQRMRGLVTKIEQARSSGDDFLGQYFLDRRTASSTIVSELNEAAKAAGLRVKEHSFGTYEPVEGSDTLSWMTIQGNYEGTYGDLLQFVNRLDRSPRFLIVDSLTAAPQVGGAALNVTVKLNIFVKDQPATLAAAAL